ncbi:hypothetical protein ABW19_dt0209213 [Dactylella cylindrospora]|nr:hypothetical protein ABW19_dt0209213 [Dactylella cylindrospora]
MMLYSGRPGLARIGAIAAVLLIIVWLYRFTGRSFFIPSLVENGGEWKQDHIDVATPTDSPSSGKAAPPTEEQKEAPPPQTTVEEPHVDTTKTVIIGRIKKDNTNWVKEQLPDWRPAIYAVDDPESQEYLHTPINKGKESMPYLTYIIDYYDDLSDINVFLHSHADGYPRAWHNEPINDSNYSAPIMLQLLRVSNVVEKGYVNLRCNGIPGCPGELHPTKKKFGKDAIEPGFKELWTILYGNDTPLPETVGVACCAQFAITKDRIREKPKEFYEKARDWLTRTNEEDEGSGRVFEYFWHILFGMPAVHCEANYYECLCRTYDCGRKRSLDLLEAVKGFA